MKKTKIILIVALGFCMLSFMPAVFGKANSRPIEDFTENNTDIAAWADTDTNLIVLLHIPVEAIADCDISGSVLERELKDGGILYKVNLHVKGANLLVFWSEVDWNLIWQPIFMGTMDYYFTTTIIVYEGELGDPIPWLWYIWFPGYFPGMEPIGECTFSHITGSGNGVFTEYADDHGLDFTPGDSAKLKLVQVGILKPDGMMWPVEVLNFH